MSIKHKFFFLFVLALALFSFTVLKKDFKIYSSDNSSVNISEIVGSLDSNRVLIFGEEHDDSIAHILELRILKELYLKHGEGLVLSLEMFDHETQPIMDEYLMGLITKRYFKRDARLWSNYDDYEPLIEFAKENKLEVICANAPFRHANLVSRLGVEALAKIPKVSREFLPPIPYKMPSERYREKIELLLGDHVRNDSTGYDLLRGQALWNASMAFWIVEKLRTRPKAKIFHINGKLHSDERLGVLEHLEYYQEGLSKNCSVISCTKTQKLPKKLEDRSTRQVDFLIFTKNN